MVSTSRSPHKVESQGVAARLSCCLWFRYVVIAGAVAHFYWNKGQRNNMPRFPVALALKNTVL